MKFSKFVEYSHNDSNKANDNILMFKITIPNTLKLDITKLLSQMNISSETLFPGLSGLSQSLNRLRDGYGNIMNKYFYGVLLRCREFLNRGLDRKASIANLLWINSL